MSVGVNIFSHFHAEGVKKAIAEFQKLDTAQAKAQFGIKKAAVPAAAALAAVAAAATHALHAAIENEVSQARFAHVLETVTGASEKQVEAINHSIEAMAKQTGITQEQLRPAFQYLVVATNSVATAQKDMALALDISAATGADLETVTSALGKAHNGVTKGLVKLDPALKKVLGSTKDFTVIQKILTDTFGGSEAAFEKTAAGGMRKFNESMHEMWISIGNALLPAFKAVQPYIQAFGDWAQKHSKTFVVVAGAIGLVSGAILLLNGYLKVTAALEAIVDLLNPFTAMYVALLALAAAMVWAITQTEGWKDDLIFLANAGIAAMEKLFNFINSGINSLIWVFNKFSGLFNVLGIDAIQFGYIGEISLGRIATSATVTEGKLQDFRKAEHAVANEGYKSGKTVADSFAGAGKSVETAAQKVKKFTDALKTQTDAQKSASSASKDVVKAQTDLISAQDKLSIAQKNFNNISKGYGSNSKEAATQTRNVAQAQRDLAKANNSVTDATNSLATAEAYLKKLREKPAAITMDNAEIGLQKAKLNAEKATFDVLDAEQALADLRTQGDATPEEIRKQEISLQEAKYAQRDATIAVTDAEAELKRLRDDSPTADEIATAERDVADAKLAVEEAIAAQQDATQKLNDENLLYSQIVSGAAADTDIYKDALKELIDAQKDEKDAIDGVAEAKERELEATIKLGEAEKELQTIKGKIGAKLVATGTKQQADALAAAQALINAKNAPAGTGTITQDQKDALMAARGGMFSVPFFADGGVVNGATLAVVGEKGAEAIIPLDQLGGMGGNTYITVNAGMGTDGAEVGKQIIDAIKKAERRSGKVFASA
jgi:hypothetical protein